MRYDSLAAELGILGVISGDELRARCPLHQDSNPSFSLNIQTGLWFCFSKCGGGEFTHLVEQILSLNPQEAREWIASRGGKLPIEQLDKKLSLELHQKPDSPFFLPQEAGWMVKYNSLEANVMPLWFLNRGFTWETIWHWKIRYDPIWDSVTIPVIWNNEMVGTVTRNTKAGLPKYQNSVNLPHTKVLFGEINHNKNNIILVEGVLDALWLWQCGYNVAGLLGTYISREQIDILKGFRFGEIVLALDNDEAGEEGTIEVMKRLKQAGWLLPQITIIRFPEGFKDAQDCWPDEFAQLYEQRKGILG